jgi:molecular chaperone GrpE
MLPHVGSDMLDKLFAYLRQRETIGMKDDSEVELSEMSETSKTATLDPTEMSQTDSGKQVEVTEQIPVAEDDGSHHSTVAVDFPALLAPIQAHLERLEALFKEKIHEDERHGQLFSQLMSELEEYRQDFLYKHILGRIFRDLIRLYDTLDQTLKTDEVEAKMLVSRLRSFREQISRTLNRQEVVLVESTLGTPFDETIQEAVDVRVVEHPEENGKVVEIVRRGFLYQDRLLRPEWVIVGKYHKDQE